jgi:uncharacterized MAPEG superfamily protein
MTEANMIAVEFWWLAVTGIVMAVTSLPYVTDRLLTAGIGKSFGNPQNNDTAQSAWAVRMKAAHYNCVENLAVFGPLCVAVVVAGATDELTAMAAAAFCLSRIAYVLVYTLGIPVLRTLAFLVGWLSTLALALRLLGFL